MENLAQMLEAGHGGEDHTLRDSQLMEEVCNPKCICLSNDTLYICILFIGECLEVKV